jgi:transcription elongation factor Elf1
MADVTKIKNGFLLECDCGVNHKVTIDEESKEIKVKTTYSKKEEKPEIKKEEVKPETKKEEIKKDEEETDTIWFE